MITFPVEKIVNFLNLKSYDAPVICHDALAELGFCIIRSALSSTELRVAWDIYKDPEAIVEYANHPTRIGSVAHRGLDFLAQDGVRLLANQIVGENVGCNGLHFFRKDKVHRKGLFLHNDLMYQSGWCPKFSLFFALTLCGPENGGINLYPGTHHFGLLGDAGELDNAVVPEDLPRICPLLQAGDAVVMNSATWHGSANSRSGDLRLYAETTLMNAADPAMRVLISGEDKREYKLPNDCQQIFKNSRLSRLKHGIKSEG